MRAIVSWTMVVLLSVSASVFAAEAKTGKTPSSGIWLHERVSEIKGLPLGPFVRLKDGGILTVERPSVAMVSRDDGKTWESRPIFADPERYVLRPERALLCTPSGAVILAFENEKEMLNWKWDPKTSDAPDARRPTFAVRSPDGGKTWETPQKLHDDWTGALRDIIWTSRGNVVFTSMIMRHNPGRHTVLTYTSADEGKTWKRSNILDRGGAGHHGGLIEATIEELRDGRIWMLIRTNWKHLWESFSGDGGLSWCEPRATDIDASSAPAILKRLRSGRLVLIWNRYFPEGQTSYPLTGGDNQWSEVPVSNHRLELSMKFSDDDGKTWTDPVVIARVAKGWLAYPYLFEVRPGELWITTMQGGLRATLKEKDFVRERR